jgi:hypothetical protein
MQAETEKSFADRVSAVSQYWDGTKWGGNRGDEMSGTGDGHGMGHSKCKEGQKAEMHMGRGLSGLSTLCCGTCTASAGRGGGRVRGDRGNGPRWHTRMLEGW